jgi:hypothetical protein
VIIRNTSDIVNDQSKSLVIAMIADQSEESAEDSAPSTTLPAIKIKAIQIDVMEIGSTDRFTFLPMFPILR